MHILLVNDDGPPGHESPFIYGFYKFLKSSLPAGSDVTVVIPNGQRSWIGKAYHIKEITNGFYYYPKDPDGLGETTDVSRPLKDGEVGEWILLDGTPSTCTNIGLYNLFPHIQFDFVISGPNVGRNSSAAFAMSSGTVGGAMAGALTGVRSIALSYGIVKHPSPPSYLPPAHALSARIILSLINNWDEDADLYSVNIPLVDGLLSEPGLDVYWTSLWRNRYGKLFKDANKASRKDEEATKNSDVPTGATLERVDQKEGTLHFKWAPDLRSIIRPAEDTVSPGSDAWALLRDAVSVTPLKAAFAEASHDAFNKTDLAERKWKL